ncbi:hypothetical protein ACLI4Q_17410 [Natrialbaceae archaeon A-CW1-1]
MIVGGDAQPRFGIGVAALALATPCGLEAREPAPGWCQTVL